MILYKKDSKNKLRILKVFTEYDTVIQQSGLIEGKLTTNIRKCKPKNIGKVNETTAEGQAEIEAKAIVEKKLKEGYFKTVEEALNEEVLMPMLAKSIDLNTVKFPVFAQPKLDGMRATTNKSKLISRKNREIDTIKHINIPSHLKLDGELYAHGLSFQENMKLIKKYGEGETELIQYWVYDLPQQNGGFNIRGLVLAEIIEELKLSNVKLVPTYKVHNKEELKEIHARFLSDGFEGTMVRTNCDTPYEYNKRSDSLLKYKDFIDKAYTIVDIVPSEKIPTHGVVMCEMDNGIRFKCGMKVSHEVREDMLRNKAEHIGQTAEVRYFELTDDGVPRFPVYVGTRLDK